MTATIKYLPPAAGAFDPTDITITDDTSGAFLIKEGSNEYMRIDTTNGSELTQFKMPFTTGGFKYIQETSAGPYEFIKADSTSVRLFPGSTGGGFNFSHITVGTGGIELASNAELRIANGMPVSGSGARAYISQSGQSWTELLSTGSTSKIQRLDGFKMLEVDTDSNATFELDTSGANYFTVKNDASANHIFRINSQTRHTEIERIGYGGNQYFGYAQDYCQRTQPACIDAVTHATGTTTLAVPDMGGSPGSGTFNNINRRTAIRIHSASQSASGDLFTATLNVGDAYDQLIREMFLYVSNYDSTNNFALKIQASAGSGNWRELNSSGITSASGQTIDAATTYIYRIFQYAPGGSTATRVYGINFMGKMAH